MPPPPEAGAPTRLPPQATMGLLDYLTSHAMDEDYAFVSRRREQSGTPRRAGRIGVTGALVMAVFAVLVVAAAAQTSRNAGADAREREALVSQVDQVRRELASDRTQVASLQSQTRSLAALQVRNDRTATQVFDQITKLGGVTGAAPVTGPGVRVIADNAAGSTSERSQVLDSDLQKLVNGFWEAGAEAIAINGQRLTNLSTIRVAGGAITVNARSLSAPYVVQVIGNKDTLPARFAETSSGQAWLDLEREVGLRLTITPVSSQRLPGTDVTLRYARGTTPEGAR